MLTPNNPYTFDRVVRILLSIALVVGVLYVLNLLKGALLPFVIAWLFAYLLNPTVLFFQNKLCRGNRLLGIITTLLTLVVVLTTLGALLIPSIIKELNYTVSAIQNISQNSDFAKITSQAWYQSLTENINIKDISQMLNPEEWSKLLEGILSQTWTILSGSITQIINVVGWLIILLYLIFILLDYDNIFIGFKRLIPAQYRETTLSILTDVESGMNRYFRGQSLIALIVGVLFSIGFVIVGLPLAIPVGLFVGLLNLVPYLQILGFIPITLLCLLNAYTGGDSFWMMFGSVLVVFGVVQTFQDVFLVPKIMGKITGFGPAVILLSLSIWGSLLGMLGMIIALPITSILVSYYQKYVTPNELEVTNEMVETENEVK